MPRYCPAMNVHWHAVASGFAIHGENDATMRIRPPRRLSIQQERTLCAFYERLRRTITTNIWHGELSRKSIAIDAGFDVLDYSFRLKSRNAMQLQHNPHTVFKLGGVPGQTAAKIAALLRAD